MDGAALGAIAAGVVFAYAGVKGYSIPGTIQQLVTGKSPAAQQQTAGIGTPSAAAAAGSSSSAGVLGVNPSALPSAGTYSRAQLEQLWQQVGGSAATAANAACHALQESSGNPQVTSSNPDGGTNVGLWQLDTKGVGAGYSVAELQNAVNNARITVQATGGGRDWSQWSTPGC